ncbi:MAG: hypothetical protein LAT68_15655 [Cyclobacteriaceae bacterium]|nr:hypothetical protein [Cyclobacteriaceae bacterium]
MSRKYKFELYEIRQRNMGNMIAKAVRNASQNSEFIKNGIEELIDEIFEGATIENENQAQLAYERWTDLIRIVEKYESHTSDKDLIEYLKKQRSYIKAERDKLYGQYSNRIEREERLFKSIWKKTPLPRMDLDERLRQQYRETNSYFELAERYYQSRSEDETWKSIYRKMNSEQTELGMEKRYKNFESFDAALKRYRSNKVTPKE